MKPNLGYMPLWIRNCFFGSVSVLAKPLDKVPERAFLHVGVALSQSVEQGTQLVKFPFLQRIRGSVLLSCA